MSEARLDELLAQFASPGPAGGGGAAVALVGATAAALVGMAAGVAAPHAPAEPRLAAIVAEAEAARLRLLALMTRDVEAYSKVIEARRRADAGRERAVREALLGAAEVPLEVAEAGARLMDQAATLLGLARRSTLADVGVAGLLAAAAVEGAAVTARANLETLVADGGAATVRRRLDELVAHAVGLRARFAPEPA